MNTAVRRLLRAGKWWSVGQCFANQELVHIPGDSVRPVVIAGDIPVYWSRQFDFDP